MGKKKAPEMPAMPDLNAAADKSYALQNQGLANQTTANRANQVNSSGSMNWTEDPSTGMWTKTEAYNPEQQALFNQQTANKGQMGKLAGGMMGNIDLNYANAPAAGQVGGFNQQATDLYNQLAQPGLDRQRAGKEAQMAAMGLNLGSGRAYDAQQANLTDSENRSNMMGAQAGIQQGNTEFGQQNQLRQNYVGEQNQMLQNAGGMMAGSGPAALSFSNDYAKEGIAKAPDYADNAQTMYQNASAQSAAKAKAKSGGMLGGMGGTLGSGIGMAFGGPMGAALGGAIGGGLDGGDMQGAISGGLGGAMQGYGGNLGWAQGMGNSVRGMFAPGYKDTAGLAAGVPQF